MIYSNENCVQTCNECAAIASYCAQQCIDKGIAECAKHCMECFEICQTTAVFAARDSDNLFAVVEACLQICEACADECEQHDHEHCQECAKACRKNADACRTLLNNRTRQAA